MSGASVFQINAVVKRECFLDFGDGDGMELKNLFFDSRRNHQFEPTLFHGILSREVYIVYTM